MNIKVVAHGDQHQSYLSNLLSTLHSMQKTSSYTDCSLITRDRTPVPVHLALLSLSWPSLKLLLPPSDSHCNCQCCVPSIAVTGDLETVQVVLQLVYTGRTELVGEGEERKVKQLLQVLGIEWELERVKTEAEFNNNNCSEKDDKLFEGLMIPSIQYNSPKEPLEDGLLLAPSEGKEIVNKSMKKSMFDPNSESLNVKIRSSKRNVIPREAKNRKPIKQFEAQVLIPNKVVQSRQSCQKDPVKVNKNRFLKMPINNNGFSSKLLKESNDVTSIKINKSLNSDHSRKLVESSPESIRKDRSKSLEKGLILTPQLVNESVTAVQKTMIAPGTLMTRIDNCVRFFCSYCELEITKFTKMEKETHWAVVHFSEELTKFTNNQACNICNRKFDNGPELVKHVGVFHKKVYNLLSVLPLVINKQTPHQINTEKFPSSKYSSRIVSIKPGNKLVVPFVFVKCTLNSFQATNHSSPPHHLTTAYIEERSGIAESVTSIFPVVKQHWYYTSFPTNNSSSSPPLLISLISHYSSLLGEEDPEKCLYCPEKMDKHATVSLHQSVDRLEVKEGRFWCGVCCHQILGEEKLFQHHLATHLLNHIDDASRGQDSRSGQGPGGEKAFHVFFSSNTDRDGAIRIKDNSADKVKVSVKVEENIIEERSSDSNSQFKCTICGKALAAKRSLKRHMSTFHSEEKLMMNPELKCTNSGIVFTKNHNVVDHLGSVHNKEFDLYSSVINAELNKGLVENKGASKARDENQVNKFLIEDSKNMKIKNAVEKIEIAGLEKQHKYEAGKKSFACKLCNLVFSSTYNIKRHLATHHFREEIWQEITSELTCDLCDRVFKLKNDLIIHVGCHHNRSYMYYNEYIERKKQVDEKSLSESDVLLASFEDEIDLNSSAGFVDSEEILTFFAQPCKLNF